MCHYPSSNFYKVNVLRKVRLRIEENLFFYVSVFSLFVYLFRLIYVTKLLIFVNSLRSMYDGTSIRSQVS